MWNRITRRQMLQRAGLAGAGLWVAGSYVRGEGASPSEKLNVAFVGCGGRGAQNVKAIAATENVVALCDVDGRRAGATFEQYPRAKKYSDYRKMLDEMENQIDAVVVSTPDHHHALPSVTAMRMGKHCYCEKPLAHSVYEARLMTETAAKAKVATQMGTQANSSEGYRRAVEAIQSGVIGEVHEVHCWTDRPGWPDGPQRWQQGLDRPTERPPVPPELKWDLWLGPAPQRPYHPCYLPFTWRGWWDFGTGPLGDMGCHICNVVFWALKLGAPVSAETRFSADDAGRLGESFPKWSIVTLEFPARENMPPVKFTWYDAKNKPPAEVTEGIPLGTHGSLFVGSKGKALVPIGQPPRLFPKAKFADFQPPEPWLPRRPEIHQDWIEACKTGKQAGCHFGYAGPMTEALLVGNVALRAGRKIGWDAAKLKVTDCPQAQQFVRPSFREGWAPNTVE